MADDQNPTPPAPMQPYDENDIILGEAHESPDTPDEPITPIKKSDLADEEIV